MVAVVMVVSVMVMPSQPYHATDTADDATGHTADNASNHLAHGTGGTFALLGAPLATTHNTLRLRGSRDRKKCERTDNHCKSILHPTLRCPDGPDWLWNAVRRAPGNQVDGP
jgi:hypothetical protein